MTQPEELDTVGMAPVGLHVTRKVRVASVPVVLTSSTFRNALIKTVRCNPGEVLDIYADLKVTNDAGRWTETGKRYTVGVGYHLWSYDATITPADARLATWAVIGDTTGQNCTVDMHHMQLNIGRTLLIPDTWQPGNAVGIVLRVAAMSTRWADNSPTGGDTLTVDPDGTLKVTRWAPLPTPPPQEEPQ